MNEIGIFMAIWRCLRHIWYKHRRKIMRFWDRFQWALAAGLGYLLARLLFQYWQTWTGG